MRSGTGRVEMPREGEVVERTREGQGDSGGEGEDTRGLIGSHRSRSRQQRRGKDGRSGKRCRAALRKSSGKMNLDEEALKAS